MKVSDLKNVLYRQKIFLEKITNISEYLNNNPYEFNSIEGIKSISKQIFSLSYNVKDSIDFLEKLSEEIDLKVDISKESD